MITPISTNPDEPGLPALGDDLENYLVTGGGSITLKLEPDDKIKIINLEGQQQAELVCFSSKKLCDLSPLQRWTNIEIPIAFLTVMLGVNQTVVVALQMVILGALIGTEDLGQIIFGALSRTKDGAGVALTLGIFVSLIAISVDVIVRNWAEDRKKALGLD